MTTFTRKPLYKSIKIHKNELEKYCSSKTKPIYFFNSIENLKEYAKCLGDFRPEDRLEYEDYFNGYRYTYDKKNEVYLENSKDVEDYIAFKENYVEEV